MTQQFSMAAVAEGTGRFGDLDVGRGSTACVLAPQWYAHAPTSTA